MSDKLSDENEAFVLLDSLPEAYKEVKNALKYGRDSVKTDVIISALRTRELEIHSSHKENHSGDGLFVKGKPQNNQSKNSNKSFLMKTRKENRKRNVNTVKRRDTSYKNVFSLKERIKKKKKILKGNNQKPL